MSAGTAAARAGSASPLRLGLRANLAQFLLLVAVNALVGATLGQERTVVPLLAERVTANVRRFALDEPLIGLIDLDSGH